MADASAWEEVSYQDDPAISPISYAHPAQAIRNTARLLART
jgi:UDP-3-O-[3-hydroxymyristoyl] N-acetylglucosamine deacetylase